MKLRDFLHMNSMSQADFARRSMLSQSTVARISMGYGCRAKHALAVIETTGGLVTLNDLVSEKQTGRAAEP